MVDDPAAVRARLLAGGAHPGFRGIMVDQRFDRDGVLTARDEVLRLRTYLGAGAAPDARLGWKGPTGISAAGHKVRRELEYPIGPGPAPHEALLEALGYLVVQTIERYVEYYEAAGAMIRLEWYPRMDVLAEVEGDARALEAGIAATGIPRAAFTADPLRLFTERYAARTGRPAVLSRELLGADAPEWNAP